MKIDQLEAKMMEETSNQIKEITEQKKRIDDLLKEIFNKWKGTHLPKKIQRQRNKTL
jgi:transcription termination factor NusB